MSRQLPKGTEIKGRYFGLDEAGRGPIAGPLVVAAVEFPSPSLMRVIQARSLEIKDSKKLSPAKRATLCELIMEHCRWSVVFIEPAQIDKFGMSDAAATAGMRAITTILRQEEQPPERIVFDGTPGNWGKMGDLYADCFRFMIDGDATVPGVSAASIVAKHCHDDYMINDADKQYPQYGFCQHMGYGTQLHLDRLEEFGSCPLHRHTFRPVRDSDVRHQPIH